MFGSNLFGQTYAHAESEYLAADHDFFDHSTGMMIRHTPTLNEDFHDDSVLVTLKREYSTINNKLSAKQVEDSISEIKTTEMKSIGVRAESDTRSVENIKIARVEDLTCFTPNSEAQFRAEKRSFAQILEITLINLDATDFVKSLTFARNKNIRVINASFCFIDILNGEIDGTYPPAAAQVNHANAIRDFPGILITSAGNAGNTRFANTDNTLQFPAGYGDARNFPNITNVISVGNITDAGAKAADSCFGLNSVHVYAPGDGILSTLSGNKYGYSHGTSMSAPHAAGVAALLLSIIII